MLLRQEEERERPDDEIFNPYSDRSKPDVELTKEDFEIARIVEEFENKYRIKCIENDAGWNRYYQAELDDYKDWLRTTLYSLTQAHVQHEHEMYEELEKFHKVEMEKMVKKILINFKEGSEFDGYKPTEAITAIAKKYNIEIH
jgi:hypothetical protein